MEKQEGNENNRNETKKTETEWKKLERKEKSRNETKNTNETKQTNETITKEKHLKYEPESTNHSSTHRSPTIKIWDQMATFARKFDHSGNETRESILI